MKISTLILSILVAMSLSACGKQGPLGPPPPRLANSASLVPQVSAPLIVTDHASL
jgi:predicted small lipoprotein YifL